ncbi:MAG: DUF6714 family protein, partial [Planctomycetota bacterium]
MSESSYLSAEAIAARSAQLLERIAVAFAGVTLGRGVSIQDADAYEDPDWPSYDKRAKRLGGKEYMRQYEDWTSLDLRNQGISHSTYYPFLSPESYRYYIPFFLTCWLEAGLPNFPRESQTPWDQLDERLYWFVLGWSHETKRGERHGQEQLSCLSDEQMRCHAEFFALCLESGVMPGEYGAEEWPMVMKYWGPHLDAEHFDQAVRHAASMIE